MDSPELPAATKPPFQLVLFRCCFALLFPVIAVLSTVLLLAFLALPFGNSSISPPISVPSRCKIVSSSVDLRSSKVCELGLLNFNANHVLYPSERKKFRCRYDYYWASVFKVEYMDHFLGQTLLGHAEAPKEALPLDCRPNFASAMLTKNMFKVNESYDCWYASGLTKVDIYQDNYFGCQVNEPSAVEMLRRYYILSTRMLNSWFSTPKLASGMGWGMVVGAASGFFSSVASVGLFKMIQPLILLLLRAAGAMIAALFRRLALGQAFFLLAYFSIVGWLTIQYCKRLGLPLLLGE
ncbi:hypothetical protein Dimus_008069 [Dionaea muscipula]